MRTGASKIAGKTAQGVPALLAIILVFLMAAPKVALIVLLAGAALYLSSRFMVWPESSSSTKPSSKSGEEPAESERAGNVQ